jgi:peptidoglycan-associated lipoprotein
MSSVQSSRTSSNHSLFGRWTAGVAVAVTAFALVGCGSSVKLDEGAPVSDRTGAALGGAGAGGAQGSGVSQSNVTGVQAGTQGVGQPPQNLSRVVYFDFDDYTVRSEFTPVLEGHAKFLNADRKRRVVLEGHTDERGGREYNLALGQKRAEAVQRALSVLGVQEAQLEAVSFGKEKLAKSGSDDDSHRLNRRVEMSYR